MTRDELQMRYQAYRRWDQALALRCAVPVTAVALAGCWLIWNGYLLSDQPRELTDLIVWALFATAIGSQVVTIAWTMAKSSHRRFGLVCPGCDGKLFAVGNQRRMQRAVFERGQCPRCAQSLWTV